MVPIPNPLITIFLSTTISGPESNIVSIMRAGSKKIVSPGHAEFILSRREKGSLSEVLRTILEIDSGERLVKAND